MGPAPYRQADPSALPAGVVTCLFTDIEGSTRLLRELGSGYEDLLARHNDVLRAAWRLHRGHEVKTIGDAFLVVFETAGDAVAAAVAAQRGLAGVAWPTELPVRVRVGMHTGYARPARGDYTALVIHQAARVVGAARGGQVLLTQDTAEALERGGLPEGVEVHSLGHFRVRDFDEPVALHMATGPGTPAVGLPPRVRPADGHNLVLPPTALIGRRDDLARLRELVTPGRLTTLVGPGGVGKTRLATETALAVAGDWNDGAWFVDLAPIGDAALVSDAIGSAVGAPSAPGAERWAEVLDHLAERQVLVVLDNCEHLAEASAQAASGLLTRCPEVGVLATSRGPLGLRGERIHRLAPLAPHAEAVELFLERSDAAAAADLSVVAELCAELDGLPLAIELAAARTSAVPVRDILRRVRRSPIALRSADPTLPERQRSLERLLDWGWDLLSPEARTVLGRLSVFAAGFGLDAAESVGAGGGVDPDDLPDLLWTLIDASLVRPEDTVGATRYRLLATVRAHAAGRADPGDVVAARRKLAALLLARLGPGRDTSHAWVAEMELELDNVRAAAAEVDDDETAQALAWSIGRYHDAIDRYRAGAEEVARLLSARAEPTRARVALLTLLGDLHLRLGELEAVDAVLEEAARLAESAGCPEWDDAGLARTRGELAVRRGDPAAAAAEARRGLEEGPSLRGRARLFNLLGVASAMQGDDETAAAAFAQELQAASEAGLEGFLPIAHNNLAESYLTLGRRSQAAEHQLASLRLARQQGQPVVLAFGLMIAARLVAAPRDAVVLQTKADELLAAAGFALYDQDQQVRTDLLEAAAGQLGQESYEGAVDTGRALGVDEAADLAERVLASVGSARQSDQGT